MGIPELVLHTAVFSKIEFSDDYSLGAPYENFVKWVGTGMLVITMVVAGIYSTLCFIADALESQIKLKLHS